VNQTSSYFPRSSLTITFHLSIYQVDFSRMFQDGNGNPLPHPPSSIQLSYPNGTSASLVPTAAYLLPGGTYYISTVTWMDVGVAPSPNTFNPMNGLSPVSLPIYDLTVLVVGQDGSAHGRDSHAYARRPDDHSEHNGKQRYSNFSRSSKGTIRDRGERSIADRLKHR